MALQAVVHVTAISTEDIVKVFTDYTPKPWENPEARAKEFLRVLEQIKSEERQDTQHAAEAEAKKSKKNADQGEGGQNPTD
jgi:hypothetical protein